MGFQPEAMRESLRTGKLTAAVYGLGHAGLPIDVAWLRADVNVVGSDADQKIILDNKSSRHKTMTTD